MKGRLFLTALLLLGPWFARDGAAQTNWRVTVISLKSGGETFCPDTAVTLTLPAGATEVIGAVCGLAARFVVGAQSVTLELTGAVNIQGCNWNITSPIRGSGFISGDAVPASGLTGTAQTQCFGGNFTNPITGSFQAQRIVAGGGGPTVVSFTGRVEVRRPGQAPLVLTPQNIGLALPSGTEMRVAAGGSLTVRFPDGDVALGENTRTTVITPRFFLLVPPTIPFKSSFMRIVWRCIPGVDGCATIATPNTRLAFLPPWGPRAADRVRAAATADTPVTVSVTYTETGGVGKSTVAVEAGSVAAQMLRGANESVAAGQTRTFTGPAAGSATVNLNADATPDILTYNPATGAWRAVLGSSSAVSSGTWARDLTTIAGGDFNGDGLTDFLLHNDASGAWQKAINDGNGGFSLVSGSWTPGLRPYVLNLNGDRWSDVLLHDAKSGAWTVELTTSNSVVDKQTFKGTWPADVTPYALDLNDDGALDLLLVNAASGDFRWAVSDKAGGFTYPVTGRWSGVTGVFTGDFNGDGLGDVLLYDSRGGAWSLGTNTGSGFSYRTGAFAPGLAILVGDVNADGRADVVGYDDESGAWSVQLGDASGGLTAGATGTWSPRWRLFGGDFNADGRFDLLLYFPETGQARKAINDAAGGFTFEDGMWDKSLSVVTSHRLTQGSYSNEAATEPCSSESTLKSGDSTAARLIDFVNAAAQPRLVYWLNQQGQRVLRQTLAPGQTYQQATFDSHPWLVTDAAGACQAIYLATAVPSLATLR